MKSEDKQYTFLGVRSRADFTLDKHRWQEVEQGEGKRKGGALSGQSKLLLTVNGLFAAANALSGTFVNVYLWKASKDFSLIGWFTLIHHLTMAITFWLAGKWVKEHNKMNCLRAGVAIAALFYLLVLWFGARAAHYFVPLGMVLDIVMIVVMRMLVIVSIVMVMIVGVVTGVVMRMSVIFVIVIMVMVMAIMLWIRIRPVAFVNLVVHPLHS